MGVRYLEEKLRCLQQNIVYETVDDQNPRVPVQITILPAILSVVPAADKGEMRGFASAL